MSYIYFLWNWGKCIIWIPLSTSPKVCKEKEKNHHLGKSLNNLVRWILGIGKILTLSLTEKHSWDFEAHSFCSVRPKLRSVQFDWAVQIRGTKVKPGMTPSARKDGLRCLDIIKYSSLLKNHWFFINQLIKAENPPPYASPLSSQFLPWRTG